MKQHMTLLVTRQDELSTINEARIQKHIGIKNLMTFKTKNVKFNENILKTAKEISQMEKKHFNPTTIAIASLENDSAQEIVIFCLINNRKSYDNRSSNIESNAVSTKMRINRKNENQESAHAHKITAVIKNQSESFHCNTSIPELLENLQWSERPDEESYRCRFLEIFNRYVIHLRAIGNYYAAKTSRYTIIEKNLLLCTEIIRKKPENTTKENRSLKLSVKKSQSYRMILGDEKSKIERRAIEDQRDYESLKKENEMLGLALRKAADLHLSMLNTAEENLQEKNKLIEEKRVLEDRNNDLSAKNKDLEKLSLQADKLKQKKESLKKSRRVLEEDKKKLIARKEVFERFNIENASTLKEERELLKEERSSIEKDRQELSSQKKVLQKLQSEAKIESDTLKSKEKSLEKLRRNFEKEKKEFFEAKEKSLKEENEKIEYAKKDLANERKKIENQQKIDNDNLKIKETMINQNYEKKTNELKEKKEEMDRHYLAEENRLKEYERSIENQRRALETRERNVNVRKQELDNEATRLENRNRSIEAERQTLQNQQGELLRQRQELQDRNTSIENQRRALETRERNVNVRKQELDNEATRLENRNRSIEAERQTLQNQQGELLRQRQELQEYCDFQNNQLQETRREIENQRRELERQRRNLVEEREENIRRVARSTPSNSGSNDKDYIEIPILPQVLSWKLKLNPFS